MLCIKYTGTIPGHAFRYNNTGYEFVLLGSGEQVLALEDDQKQLYMDILQYRSRIEPFFPSRAQMLEIRAAMKDKQAAIEKVRQQVVVSREQSRIAELRMRLQGIEREINGKKAEIAVLEERAAEIRAKLPEPVESSPERKKGK